MVDALAVTIAGEPMQLLADRALHWPRERALMIADLHLGKADTFRSSGIALPRGGTQHDLDRIARLISTTGAQQLVVLGDFLHAGGREAHWRACWEQWRRTRAALRIVNIEGNHDRALAQLDLDIEQRTGTVALAPFELAHAPSARPRLHRICGHVHPRARLPGIAGRWPAFVLDTQQTILPAFSAFTGGVDVDARGRRLAVCNGEQVELVERPR